MFNWIDPAVEQKMTIDSPTIADTLSGTALVVENITRIITSLAAGFARKPISHSYK
jgi:hypothetical protein